MGRRNEHSREELRDLALRAAAEIVDSSSAAALSMREVARRIGYTVGALYIVFENLDDLIVGLNERTVAELRAALEKIRGRANQPAPVAPRAKQCPDLVASSSEFVNQVGSNETAGARDKAFHAKLPDEPAAFARCASANPARV